MDVAFCVFDGMTVLDVVGAYDPITRLDRLGTRSIDWDVCARVDSVTADRLQISVDRTEPDLGEYDLVFLPGGPATRDRRSDERFVEWLRTAESCEYLVSVCTGSLLLGAAGFLDGRKATTHPGAFDVFGEYAEVIDDRVVREGRVITGRGVSSSLDLGRYVVQELTDGETRRAVATEMDYSCDGDFVPN